MKNRQFKVLTLLCFFLSACASDKNRIKESRDAFLKDDFVTAESALYTPEVFKYEQNRLQQYYYLGSIALSQGLYEKAIYFLNQARGTANEVRSASGLFEWFSKNYKSNPIEYSYLHSMLVMSNLLLAEEGKSPAWTTPEIKNDKGQVMIAQQTHAARSLDAREIANLRRNARAECGAWDVFLQNLKRTYPDQKFYKDDEWARVFAAYVHGLSADHNEKRTAELLLSQATDLLQTQMKRYPSSEASLPELKNLLAKIPDATAGAKTFLVVEAGVMPTYKIKRFHLGLTTLFKEIKDPALRALIEEIGLRVLLYEAPEFGLIAISGAVAGAISGSDDEFDGPPRYFSEAVDASLGFEIRFPSMTFLPKDLRVSAVLSQNGATVKEIALPVVSPLQDIIATEMKDREGADLFQKAVSIGAQYLAILIPAIKAYKQADRDQSVFGKLAVLAGFYIAKKAIDNANAPDLRSWNLLPQLIAANIIDLKPGNYDLKLVVQTPRGREEKGLPSLPVGQTSASVQKRRVGSLPNLR